MIKNHTIKEPDVSSRRRFLKLVPLAVMSTNPDGAGIVQTIGPLKTLAASSPAAPTAQRFLIVTELNDSSHVVLRQRPSKDRRGSLKTQFGLGASVLNFSSTA
jgi:hypothetical protein